MALPALIGAGGRALLTGSKLAKTANVGYKALKIKPKDKQNQNEQVGGNKSSALIVRPQTSLVPQTLAAPATQGPVDVKSSPVSSKSTLEEDVRYIKDKTIEIDKLLKGSFSQRKKEEVALRKERAAARRRGKEERFEKGGRRGGMGIAEKAKKPFSNIWEGIKNYITAVLLGFLAVRLAPLLPKLLDLAKFIAPVIEFAIDAFGFLLNGLVTFIDWGYKAYDATLGFIKTLGGENAAKAFEKFSDVFNKVMNLALILAMAGAAGGGFGGGRGGRPGAGARPGTGGRPKVTTSGGRAAGRPDLRSPLRERPRVTTTGGGAAGRPDIRSPLRSRPTVTTGAGKVAAEFGEQGLKKSAGKFIRPLVKRLPIVGGLIDFGISVALGESLGRAAFKAIGATILGAIGTGFGGPVGAILGGLAGDYAGGKLYDIFFSGKKDVDNRSKVKRKAAGGYIDPISTGDTVAQYQVGGLTGLLGGITLPPMPKFSIPDMSKNVLGKAVGGIKKLFGMFGASSEKQVENRSEPLIALANKVKDVPLIGGAMFAAVNLALGNKTDTNVYKAIAGQLTNFSNLNAFGKVSSSLGKLNLVRMATGGEVASTTVTLTPEDNIIAVNNISSYLRNQFSDLRLDTLLEEETEKQDGKDGTQPGPDLGPPGAPSGGLGGLTPNAKALLDTIRWAEGTYTTDNSGYNIWFGGSKYGGDLSKKTIAEVIQLQKKFLAEGRGNFRGGKSAAVGAYQMTYPENFAKRAGFDINKTYFTPAVQDKMAIAGYMKGQARMTDAEINAPISKQQIAKMSGVWASLPTMSGVSAYGQPVKKYSDLEQRYNQYLGIRKKQQESDIAKQQKQGSLLGSIQRLFGGGEQTGGDVPKGSVVQWLHGNPNRKGYDSGHAGQSNAHDHFSFKSRSAAVNAYKKLKGSGYKPYEFEGFDRVGKHSPTGGHYGPVGGKPTYSDPTDGTAFDIPWATYGSGPIGKRDYDLSFKAAQIVGAAQGGGVVPGAFRDLQSTMPYDKSRTRVVVQPMIVEKEVPMPMPMGGGTKVIVASDEVNSMADNLFAG